MQSDIKDLPEPITSQCVRTNGNIFHFFTYQLNSLTMDTKKKNIAFVDSNQSLYERTEPKRAMLRNTTYLNYNPDVVRKFIAYYLNGINFE